MEIRRAERADIPGILPILNDLDRMHQEWYPDQYKPLPEGRPVENVVELLTKPSWETWVAVEGGQILGLVAIEHREIKDHLVSRDRTYILLDMLAVDEKKRGMGVGKSLVDKVKERAKEEGHSEVQLKVVMENKRAFQWYLDLGFEEMMSLMYLKL